MKFGAYIQVPFCQSKCTYCNFHTGVFPRTLQLPYVRAVCREIHLAGAARVGMGAIVDTVYIGGGTPSLLQPAMLASMMAALRQSFRCELDEATLEADPETVTEAKARHWAEAGINRVSMGAQSFADEELQAAGRMHRRRDIYLASKALAAAEIGNLSLDLLAGLAHQTRESWAQSLEEVIAMRPSHISVYMLEIDESSRLGREVLAGGSRYSAKEIPSDDEIAEFFETACERLGAAGYEHYEISNWALREENARAGVNRSRHNLKYWRRDPYLGFGAGAHSFDGRMRWANAHGPAEYTAAMEQDHTAIDSQERLSPQLALDEELFLGLRLLEGINLGDVERRYHVSLSEKMEKLAAEGLIEIEGERVRLVSARLAISNEVFMELIS
jgi:oxygen-independent coproporphyrinogen-3 oxidase